LRSDQQAVQTATHEDQEQNEHRMTTSVAALDTPATFDDDAHANIHLHFGEAMK